VGDALPASGGEGCGVVRQGLDAESGEQAESQVERGNQGAGDEAAEERGRGDELRDDPERAGSWGDAGGELKDLLCGEAIQEKVSGNEGVAGLGGLPKTCVRAMGGEAGGVGTGAMGESGEHGGADVHGVDLE